MRTAELKIRSKWNQFTRQANNRGNVTMGLNVRIRQSVDKKIPCILDDSRLD